MGYHRIARARVKIAQTYHQHIETNSNYNLRAMDNPNSIENGGDEPHAYLPAYVSEYENFQSNNIIKENEEDEKFTFIISKSKSENVRIDIILNNLSKQVKILKLN